MYFYFSYYLYIVLLFLIDTFVRKDIFIVFAILTIIIISGTRFETGYDFLNYVGFYKGDATDSHEPIFISLIYLLNLITNNPQLFFFFSSLITIVTIYIAIKKYTKYHKTAILIFLLVPGLYLNTFSIVRQGVAEAFLFLAIYYLAYENKSLKFWIFSIISVGFHYTAIIPILIVWVFKKVLSMKYSSSIYVTILIFSIILSRLNFAETLLGVAFGRFATYLNMTHDISILKLIVSNLFFVLLLLFYKRIINNKSDLLLFNLLFVGTVIINIFASFVPVTRLSYYFLIFQIILVPKLIYSFRTSQIKAIFLSGFIFYYSLMFANALIVDEESKEYPKMTPYQNYFFKD